jgi:hypothetical protein
MRNNENRFGIDPQQQEATPPQLFNQQEEKVNPLSLNFITPTEFVDLPSKGKFYPTSHPLQGKDVIEITEMTAKEEDILTSRNLLKKGIALDKLLQSIIIDKKINADSLTVEDRNAILIAARISGYGPEYITQVACPSCNEKVKSKFNLLEKLETQKELLEVPIDENGHFEIQLPKTNWKVKCRVLNGHDEKLFYRLSEKNKDNDSILVEQLKAMVVSIQGVTDKETVNNAISALPAKDSRYLRSEYQKIVVGVDLTKTFNCTSCDFSAEMEIPLTTDFFWSK